jgi:hypothetical protein
MHPRIGTSESNHDIIAITYLSGQFPIVRESHLGDVSLAVRMATVGRGKQRLSDADSIRSRSFGGCATVRDGLPFSLLLSANGS